MVSEEWWSIDMGATTASSSTPKGPQLSTLIKDLCALEARNELQRVAHIPKQQKSLHRRLVDVAFTSLLNLEEDDPLDDADVPSVEEGLAEAQKRLESEGFPELGDRLTALLSSLSSCSTCSVLSAAASERADRPPTTPFTDHPQLLRLLLRLQGSVPSVRCRHVSFQQGNSDVSSSYGVRRGLDPATPESFLRASVFAQAPNPDALFNAPGTSVYLHTEAGMPSGALAGALEVASLDAGMSARPAWGPAAVRGLPPLESQGWLPLPPALVEMRGDERRTAPPPPLQLSLATLAMEAPPGAATGFGSQESSQRKSPLSGRIGVPGGGAVSSPEKGRKPRVRELQVGDGSLWTLEEAELARDAVLALQGVHSSLLRLRGALAAARALPRPAAAGVVREIEAAATCRQQLQTWVQKCAANSYTNAGDEQQRQQRKGGNNVEEGVGESGDSAGDGVERSGANNRQPDDPVLTAFAAAVGAELLRLNAELSFLETSHATEWVRGLALVDPEKESSEDTAVRGKVLHGRGLSLTRVAVLTGSVRRKLRALAVLCRRYCLPPHSTQTPEAAAPPLQGAQLLDWLCEAARRADEQHQEMARRIFYSAARPLLLLLRQWAFSTAPLQLNHPYATPQDPLAVQMQPAPPAGRRQRLPAAAAVPGPLPAFLAHLEGALLGAGTQLRILHSVEGFRCRELAAKLSQERDGSLSVLEEERVEEEAQTGADDGAREGLRVGAAPSSPLLPTSQLEEFNSFLPIGDGSSSSDAPRWLSFGGPLGETLSFNYDTTSGSSEKQDSGRKTSLEEAMAAAETGEPSVLTCGSARGGKLVEVDVWLAELRASRRREEAAARAAAVDASAALSDDVARVEAAKASELTRRQSVKAALLQEQVDALFGWRHQRRPPPPPTASSSSNGIPRQQQEQHALGHPLPPPPVAAATAFLGAAGADARPPLPLKPEAESGAAAVVSAADSLSLGETNNDHATAAPFLQRPSAIVQPASSTSAGAVIAGSASRFGEKAKVAAVLESKKKPMEALAESPEEALSRAVLTQYHAVSRACLGLFVDHLQLRSHLSFMRQTFFMEAGDWADAFLAPLAEKIASLKPLSAHALYAALQDATKSSSLDQHPLASRLEAELLPAANAVSCFRASLEPGRPAPSFPRARAAAAAPLLLAPASLDGLDCVLLQYAVHWPLSAVLTEDIAVGYAAAFAAMLRVRRVALVLRMLRPRLAARPSPSAPPFAPKAMQRLQRLRVFFHSAARLTAAVQVFQGRCTSGRPWESNFYSNLLQSEGGSGSGGGYNTVSDLQNLVDEHRAYVAGAAADALTYCNNLEVQLAAEEAMAAALDVAIKTAAAVDSGLASGGVHAPEWRWARVLERDAAWGGIEEGVARFTEAEERLKAKLIGTGGGTPLGWLAAGLC